MVHPRWSESLSWAPRGWDYFAERLRDGVGGNGYNYDIWGFEAADPDHIEPIVATRAAQVATATFGPMGEAVPIMFDRAPHTAAGGEGSGGQAQVSVAEITVQQDPGILVERVPAPRWTKNDPALALEPFHAQTGEDPGWGFAIPWVYRVLASPLTHERMPAAPRPGDPDHAVLGYWAALLHMLIFSLGWARPDRGLRWWYEARKPVDDPRLRLLSQVWDADGQLDWFAAWLWSGPMIETGRFTEVTGYRDDRRPVEVDRAWMERQRVTADTFGHCAPFSSGRGDPLHLLTHWPAPLEEPAGEAFLVRTGTNQRRAVLMCDSMVGWYRALAVHGAELPALSGRSWHVDVVVRPAGWLGTYRRSRETGLWFAGRHRFHTPGT